MNAIRLYTDGSETTKGVEAGMFGPRTKYSRSRGMHAIVLVWNIGRNLLGRQGGTLLGTTSAGGMTAAWSLGEFVLVGTLT